MKCCVYLTICSAVLTLSGCTYYTAPAPAGYYQQVPPTSFERSFTAAAGAMRDQGLAIHVEDRAAGTVAGTRDGMTITANVRTQADGSVRVQFDSHDARDRTLIDRISNSYDQRMGR